MGFPGVLTWSRSVRAGTTALPVTSSKKLSRSSVGFCWTQSTSTWRYVLGRWLSLAHCMRNAWRNCGDTTARWRIRGSSSDACAGMWRSSSPAAARVSTPEGSRGRMTAMRWAWSRKLMVWAPLSWP